MSKPLKLYVVSDSHFDYLNGGKETRQKEIFSRIQPGTWKIHFFTMKWWDGKAPSRVGMTLHSLGPKLQMYRRRKRSVIQSVLFAILCFRLLFFSRPALVDADQMPLLHLFPMRIITRIWRVPLLCTWHEVWGPAAWRNHLGPVFGKLAWWVEKFLLTLPDHFVAASPEVALRLRSYGVLSSKISEIPPGIEEVLARDDSFVEHGLIVSIGRLVEHKNFDTAIQALGILRKKGFEYRLQVIGEGPDYQRLIQLVKDQGLSNFVTISNDISEDTDLDAIRRRSMLFLAPSDREGFGIAVAEALACGVPVVTSNHLDNFAHNLITEGANGFIAESRNPESFASAIARAVGHKIEANTVRQIFLEKHCNLSWQKASEDYFFVLQRLANES